MTKSSSRRRSQAETDRFVASARRLIQARRYADAIEPLSEAARLAPNDAVILNNLGLAYLEVGRVPDAITWMRRSIQLRPREGYMYYNFGLALQESGDNGAAIVAYREAGARSPELAGAQGRLGDLLWEKGEAEEAGSAYHRAAALAPATTVGRLCKAMALRAQDRLQEAEDELKGLITSEPSEVRAHYNLGRLLQETGRFDEAALSYDHCIALRPLLGDAHFALVSPKTMSEKHRPWLTRILSRLEATDEEWNRCFTPAVAARQRMALHFAAGKAFDDLRDYGSAMNQFNAANAIRRRFAPFDRIGFEQSVERAISRYTREFLAAHSTLGESDPTPVLIVGMPRSGTTLVERIVSSHPKVHGCGEVPFWNERGPVWANAEPRSLSRVAEKLRSDYVNLTRHGAGDVLRATDKMPFNFLWVGLVHLLFPNARFVHVRRNAVDTCLSIYTTPFRVNWGFASAHAHLVSYYRTYRRLMDHWRLVIPRDRLLEVDYESVVADPETAARRLVSFVGLEWDAACLRPEQNQDAVMTASVWQARQPVYRGSVERWRRYEPWIGELRELLHLA